MVEVKSGRSGAIVYRVEVSGKDLGYVKLFETARAADTEGQLLELLEAARLERMKVVTNREQLALDGDASGQERALLMAAAPGQDLKELALEVGKDPAQRAEALRQLRAALVRTAEGLAELHARFHDPSLSAADRRAGRESDAMYFLRKLSEADVIAALGGPERAQRIEQVLRERELPRFPALSAVRLDWNIWWDKVPPHGSYESRLQSRRVPKWAPALEARHGYLPWLHAEELYGTWEPDREIVTEHPVGLAAVRPELAARRRPPPPAALVEAIRARLDPTTRELRERALVAPLPGGRLVGTLENAEPHPDMRDLVTLVTLTIQQAPSPAPEVFDQRTGRVVPAAARATLQLAIPTTDWPKLPPLPPAVPPEQQWGDDSGAGW